MLIISNNVFADAWTEIRNSCNWFTNRYKCHVGIKKQGQIGNYCSHTSANCSGVEEECSYTEYGGSNPYQVTWARAYAKVNEYENETYEFGGYDGTDQWYAGEDMSFLVPKYAKYFMTYPKMLGSNTHTSTSLKMGQVIFDEKNRKILIYNIHGVIKSNPVDITNDFAAFSISITRSNKENTESTNEYLARRIWHSNAFFNNGKLSLGGSLKQATVNVKKNEDNTEIVIEIPFIEISIPASIDMSEIEVNNGVDNGNKGEGVSEKFVINEDAKELTISEEVIPTEVFELSNYPNPIESNATTVTIKLPETEEIEVELCNYDGKVVDKIFKGEAKKEEILEFQIRTDKVSNGIGYIRLITGKKILMRKILIER